MHAVAPERRSRFDDRDYVRPGLHQLVRDDDTDIAGANDQDTLAWQHPVDIDKRLGASRRHHSRQYPTRKAKGILVRPCRQDEARRIDRIRPFAAFHSPHLELAVDADNLGLQADIYSQGE